MALDDDLKKIKQSEEQLRNNLSDFLKYSRHYNNFYKALSEKLYLPPPPSSISSTVQEIEPNTDTINTSSTVQKTAPNEESKSSLVTQRQLEDSLDSHKDEILKDITSMQSAIQSTSSRIDDLSKKAKTAFATAQRSIEASEEARVKAEVAQVKANEAVNQIDDSKQGAIQTLGVFVALFTFVSINFSFLKELVKSDLNAVIGLATILAGILLGFILVLDFIVHRHRVDGSRNMLIGYILVALIALVCVGGGFEYLKATSLNKDLAHPGTISTVQPAAGTLTSPQFAP